MSEKGSYRHDSKEGLWEYFNYEGKLTDRGAYKNGLKDGPWQETERGRKAGVNYKNGKKVKKIPSLGSQIAPCWFRDPGSQADQVKLTVVMALDRSGRVNSKSIQIVDISGGGREAQRIAKRRAKIAIISCGKDGYKVPKDMLEQKVEIVFGP